MKSKNPKIQILKKGILLILALAIMLPSGIYATEGLTLQESTALEKLMYGEIGSVVRKIEEHFKSNTTLYIVNETQLRALAEYVNNGNSCQGKKIELLNNIQLSTDIDWTPIGNSYSEFSGTFNGNGYAITYLTYKCLEDYQTEGGYYNIGLFGVISKNGKVINVNVNNSNIVANGLSTDNIFNVGNIAGTNYGTVQDVSANKMPLNKTQVNEGTEENNYIGLLVGENKGTIKTSESTVLESETIKFEEAEVNVTAKVYVKENITGSSYKEVTDFSNTIYLQAEDKIKVAVTFDKYLYVGLENGKEIKLADEYDKDGKITEAAEAEIYPKLTMGSVVFNPASVTADDENVQTELVYEATIANEEDKEITSSKATVDLRKNMNDDTLYVYYSEDAETFNTGNVFSGTKGSVSFSGIETVVDTKLPSVSTYAYVEEQSPAWRYTAGKEVIIKVTSTEKIKATVAPDISISFSESGLGKYNCDSTVVNGNAKHIDAVINGDGTTTWIYSYIIQEGDEGTLSIEYLSGKITDLSENTYELTKEEKYETSLIYADTTVPTVKIEADKTNPSNESLIKYTFKFSEPVEGFTKEDITIANGNIVKLEKINGPIVEKIIKYGDVNNDNKITEYDMIELLRAILFPDKYSGAKDLNNDYNEDGKVNEDDCLLLLEYARCGSVNGEDIIYEAEVQSNIAEGNVGEIIVTLESGVCQDLVGFGNIRAEHKIVIDKKAPILLNVEGYADTDITLNKEIDTVKQYYRTNEKITIIATFDENIVATEIPTLSLAFSESGNAKGSVTGALDGNKIIYTYNLTAGDKGTLTVKGFSGTIADIAGNETKVTKRVLDGDTIIADTISPNLQELNVTTSEGTYNAGKTIRIEAIYNEEVYALKDSEIKNITSELAPILKVRFGSAEEKTSSVSGYGTKEDGSVDKTKLIYTCEIEDGENGVLTITSYQNTEEVQICDIAGNIATLNKKQTGNTITADTIRPEVTNITASVVNPQISGTEIYHKEGNRIKVTLTFSEKVSSAVLMPEILIGFSESAEEEPETYNTYAYESDWNVNSTTIEYSYYIAAGDNGYLWVKVPENQFRDEAGNKNIAEDGTKLSNIYADTTAPTITLLKDTEINQTNQTITIKATFNENIYDLNGNAITSLSASNAPKLIYSFGTGLNKEATATGIDGATITYVITKDAVNDNGTLHYELAKGNLCDRAGNEYYQETTDTTAPILEKVYITSNSEYGTYCKAGTEIYVTALFNEELSSQNMKLKVHVGEGQEKEIGGIIDEDNSKKIVFTYRVLAGDNGEFKVLDITGNTSNDENLEDKTYGYVKDLYGNQANIYNLNGYTITGRAIADTIAPTLEITSNVEKTNKDIIEYTFTWSETVTGFTASDIDVVNGIRGELETVLNTNGKVYKLKVEILEEGRQIIKVNSGVCIDLAGNESEERFTYNKVYIDYTKPVIRAKLNGGDYVIGTDSRNSAIVETIVINEELSKFEYVWSTSETIPESGWIEADVSNIFVDSDINLKAEFAEEGTYYLYIKAVDDAGNETNVKTKGFVVAEEDITLTPDNTEITNEDVTVTVRYGDSLTENRKAGVSGISSSADTSKVIVSENGIVYAEATDKAGNKVYKKLEINNIDKTAPEATIEYITNEEENTVTAKVTFNENTTITNNNGNNEYVFTENGEFTFEFKDVAGNKGTAKAVVTSIEIIEEDKAAPVITFKYTLTTTTLGNSIGATINTDEDAIISYSWDNENWETTENYLTNQNAVQAPTEAGTYTLYAKATDKVGNQSEVKELKFTVLEAIENVGEAEIIFEDLTTIQADGVKYVKISSNMTSETVTDKMNTEALNGKTPEYTNLTEDKKLKTGSEISIDGETKYVIIVNGDVNCDGKVTFLGDIVMTNNYRIGINKNLKTIQLLAADINNSGNIEFIPDIVAMNNYRLGKINSL